MTGERTRISNNRLSVEFDSTRGVIYALGEGAAETNYAGNCDNISSEVFRADPVWTGDVQLRSWQGDGWRKEVTSHSGDVRTTKADTSDRTFITSYDGQSADDVGLRSVGLESVFELTDTELFWRVSVRNTTKGLLELGEVAFPFIMNTDHSDLFAGPHRLEGRNWDGVKQQQWHERKVMQHFFVSGSSSYVTLLRPSGEMPFLLFHTVGSTALEAAYQVENTEGYQWDLRWEGQYLLAAYSWAARDVGRWLKNQQKQKLWFNGHTSLLLEPGQTRDFAFRFVMLDSYSALGDELYSQGQVAADARPGFVMPIDEDFHLQLRCKSEPTVLPECSGMSVRPRRREDDRYRFTLRFSLPGQKKLRIQYAGDRWTNLLFYAIPPAADLLEGRARFIAERHLYDNPHDPYGRHHAFLPYDDTLETLFLEADEQWQVGGSDEYCLPIAMFLAEKNVHLPNKREIEVLETYIEDFLYGVLQDRTSYAIKRGMYYVDVYPSRKGKWDAATAHSTERTLNYPLVMDIYHAMYRVGRLHNLTERRTASQYLEMAWRTAMEWFTTGRHINMGAPGGSNVVSLLADLEREDRTKHHALSARLKSAAHEIAGTAYPFGSELYVDQTAHDQVYAMMKLEGRTKMVEKTLRVTKALRSGQQPFWFLFGNEKRGNTTCWYAQTLNSRALLDGFEHTGDQELLRWGHAGLMSFLTTVRSTGVLHGWFTWWPDRTGHDPRSLDGDLGLYGYLRAAKSYVVEDEQFGILGYGCSVEAGKRETLTITPSDGLRKRLRVVTAGLDIVVERGELAEVVVNTDTQELRIRLEDTTGLIASPSLWIAGLRAGEYRVACGTWEGLERCDDGKLTLRPVGAVWPCILFVERSP